MDKPKTKWRPSPNFSARTGKIEYIVLHGTGKKNDKEALSHLCNPKTEVSCHYYITEKGKLYQLVGDADVAWHAGVSAWGAAKSLNFNSIGIELFNSTAGNGKGYNLTQMKTLVELLSYLIEQYGIPLENVLGHSDIAPARKTDPGRFFNWFYLYWSGVALPLPDYELPTSSELSSMGYRDSYKNNLRAYMLRQGVLLELPE